MSPEQASGKTKYVGPAADIYALGVILYELLSGTTPFRGDETWDVVRQVIQDEPESLTIRSPGLSRDLDLICSKCLAKTPAGRYLTAAAFAADLANYREGKPISVHPEGRLERMVRWVRRNPTRSVAYGVAAVALVLAGLTSGAVWLWQNAETARGTVEQAKGEIEEARGGEEIARKAAEQDRNLAVVARNNAETAQKAADTAREQAESARKDAVNARDQLAREQEKLAILEYGRTVQVALQEWRENNVAGALQLLNGTRKEFRGWEWDYVHRLCNGQIRTLKEHSGPITASSFSPDGKLLVTGSSDKTARIWEFASGN
jgi:hypothetical protein